MGAFSPALRLIFPSLKYKVLSYRLISKFFLVAFVQFKSSVITHDGSSD